MKLSVFDRLSYDEFLSNFENRLCGDQRASAIFPGALPYTPCTALDLSCSGLLEKVPPPFPPSFARHLTSLTLNEFPFTSIGSRLVFPHLKRLSFAVAPLNSQCQIEKIFLNSCPNLETFSLELKYEVKFKSEYVDLLSSFPSLTSFAFIGVSPASDSKLLNRFLEWIGKSKLEVLSFDVEEVFVNSWASKQCSLSPLPSTLSSFSLKIDGHLPSAFVELFSSYLLKPPSPPTPFHPPPPSSLRHLKLCFFDFRSPFPINIFAKYSSLRSLVIKRMDHHLPLESYEFIDTNDLWALIRSLPFLERVKFGNLSLRMCGSLLFIYIFA